MKTLVYGAGDNGINIIKHFNLQSETVAIADANPELWGKKPYGIEIIPPSEICRIKFDRLILSVIQDKIRLKVYHELLQMGVEESKICFKCVDFDDGHNCRLDFARWMKKLTLYRIKGSIAEAGVYRGDMAFRLNNLFYDRKMYLFDTFEGFTDKDISTERELSDARFINSQYNKTGGFETSIELVMRKMPYPENVVIKKGYVPDSFAGIDDTFTFVNLDMDLYAPMLAAMKWFYPRMEQGGVMLIHDYEYEPLPGVKRAVDDFEADSDCFICKVMTGGGLAIIKT